MFQQLTAGLDPQSLYVTIHRLMESGQLPVRITHNDTKFNSTGTSILKSIIPGITCIGPWCSSSYWRAWRGSLTG
ncbi:MAG: hypothetical protein ISS17_08810 [Bacteroidales bacterium]|nr:hypothetical protein [Bacteroidales bacterium]